MGKSLSGPWFLFSEKMKDWREDGTDTLPFSNSGVDSPLILLLASAFYPFAYLLWVPLKKHLQKNRSWLLMKPALPPGLVGPSVGPAR